MKTFDVQSIEISAPFARSFEYLANPGRLPEWTSAFKQVEGGKARMQTDNGTIDVDLVVTASPAYGTVDWTMTFPDRTVATACSRMVPNGNDSFIYSFVLTAPPLPLEQLEGALAAQSRILGEELERLRRILEANGEEA